MKELYMANRGKQAVNLAVCAAAIVAAEHRRRLIREHVNCAPLK